jgi:hypothetical protein
MDMLSVTNPDLESKLLVAIAEADENLTTQMAEEKDVFEEGEDGIINTKSSHSRGSSKSSKSSKK